MNGKTFSRKSREFPKNQSRSSGIPKSRKFSIPNFGNPEIPKISIPKFREFQDPENFGNPEFWESKKNLEKNPYPIGDGINDLAILLNPLYFLFTRHEMIDYCFL